MVLTSRVLDVMAKVTTGETAMGVKAMTAAQVCTMRNLEPNLCSVTRRFGINSSTGAVRPEILRFFMCVMTLAVRPTLFWILSIHAFCLGPVNRDRMAEQCSLH